MKCMQMSMQRITITLPSEMASRVRKRAKATKRPISRIVRDAVALQDQEEIRQSMIEGYIATREENRKLAEEWFEIGAETWPDDDWTDDQAG